MVADDILGDDGPIGSLDCAAWLDAKYRRHKELENAASAQWLRRLTKMASDQAAELAALRAELHQTRSDRQREHDMRCRLAGEAEALRARVAVAELLLQKMCDACDTMPDDVAEWLHNEGN